MELLFPTNQLRALRKTSVKTIRRLAKPRLYSALKTAVNKVEISHPG